MPEPKPRPPSASSSSYCCCQRIVFFKLCLPSDIFFVLATAGLPFVKLLD